MRLFRYCRPSRLCDRLLPLVGSVGMVALLAVLIVA